MSSLLERKQELQEQIELTKELNEQLHQALDIVVHNPDIVDGIQLASEIGRLDLVSIILTIIGIILAIVAFGGFWMIRGAAINAAAKAAREEASSILNKEAREMFGQAAQLTSKREDKSNITVPDSDVKEILGQATEVKENGL